MQLFRHEALRGQDRLHGDVVLVPPVSWQLLGVFLLSAVLVAAAFLASASYGKVTSVTGRLAGDRGIVRAMPARAGIVEAVLVREGQPVAAGTPLARIAIATPDGEASLEARRSAALAQRDSILRGTEPELLRSAEARVDALRAQIAGDRAELSSIAAQAAEQRGLIRSASADLAQARQVASRGFVSARDILDREEQLATRRQGLSRLDQDASARRARIARAEAELARARSELALERSELAGARAELARAAAADENASTIIVTAAEAGIVTGIATHPGASATTDRPLMSIVPAGTRLQARIEVPPAAAGFLEAGQPIRIAVDAFPYQSYGTVEGRIDSVSAATVPVERPDSGGGEAFLVHATLRDNAVTAFGRRQPLRPGMTVSARITTRTRSLAEWLFEPLFAVARR